MENKLPKQHPKLKLKRLLLELTIEKNSMFNSKFNKQVEGCSMGGTVIFAITLSVIFYDIYMTNLERKIVEPTKPQFYKTFVDDIINKRLTR